MNNGTRQILTSNTDPAPPTPEARSDDALASLAAIEALRVEAQAKIDATQKTFPIGSYNTSPDKGNGEGAPLHVLRDGAQ